MLRATVKQKDGRMMLILGLSELNIIKLKQGQPIHHWMDDMGLNGYDIVIFTGKDEKIMTKTLANHLGIDLNEVLYASKN